MTRGTWKGEASLVSRATLFTPACPPASAPSGSLSLSLNKYFYIIAKIFFKVFKIFLPIRHQCLGQGLVQRLGRCHEAGLHQASFPV